MERGLKVPEMSESLEWRGTREDVQSVGNRVAEVGLKYFCLNYVSKNEVSVTERNTSPVISPRMWLKYLMQMMIKKIRVFFWQLLKHPSILLAYCAWNKGDQSIL